MSTNATTFNKTDRSNPATTLKSRVRRNKKTATTSHRNKHASKGRTAKSARSTRKGSKQQICLDLLWRAEGATVEELRQVTGWQAHSVRGFLAGAVKRKLGMAFTSEKADGQPRRYRIPQA
jgi:Protein of unknown function (DUF3489)